jgi:crotonobetainyl-CoA:carnitine CoA-transferase CaiB-like acyl-CoA transferase
MRQRPTAEWISALEVASVPCGPINTLPQVFADPHVIARQAVHTMTRDDGTDVRLTSNPIRMSETPPRADHPPPALGADTDTILTALLNADEKELRALRKAGVI